MHIAYKCTKSPLKSILIALAISFIGLRVKMDLKGYFVIFTKKIQNYIKSLDNCLKICYNSSINQVKGKK